MTPEIIELLVTTYGPIAALVAWIWWNYHNSPARSDPTKALFDKLDRIEKKIDQMDQRDDTMHDRLTKLETREEMRGR